MYMIWQVIVQNGQQRPLTLAFPYTLVLTEEACTAAPAATRVIATASLRLTTTSTVPLGHFYICRTEC